MNLLDVLVALMVLAIVMTFDLNGEVTTWRGNERAILLEEAALAGHSALDTSLAQLVAGQVLPGVAYFTDHLDSLVTRVNAQKDANGLWEVSAIVYVANQPDQPLVEFQTLQAVKQ